MAYQGDPRAFAAQSMLQPLQRHTPTQAPNKLMDFLGDVAIKGMDVGASYLGGNAGAAGAASVGNPAMMQAAQGCGVGGSAGWNQSDRDWLKRRYGMS